LSSAKVAFTGRAEGDMGHGGGRVEAVRPDVEARRRAVVDLPWTWLRQVHGAEVVRVDHPGHAAGSTADAVVASGEGCALAVLTADCAPVALASPEGVIGVAHAGWRGLVAGVLEATVREMRALGATDISAVLGPCIRPGCYAFGADDLDSVAARLGDVVRATTGTAGGGGPALDVPAGVRAALVGAGVDPAAIGDVGTCTACSAQQFWWQQFSWQQFSWQQHSWQHFSWRARREQQRQAAVIWR